MPDTAQLIQLRDLIEQHFNEEEVRSLCFNIGANYEDLGGRGRAANIRELVEWAGRNNQLSNLTAAVKTARPESGDILSLLPPHHIFFSRNALFTGREGWLTQLHEQLTRSGKAVITQAVTGLGGVGKTQLVIEYCYQHVDAYDLIQCLRVDDAVTLAGEMAELAYRLGLAQRSVTDQEALRQLALNWLHTTDRRWLLLFDNADTIQPADLRPFLPQMGNGVVLITSRNPNWDRVGGGLRLDGFTEAEAVAFLGADSGDEATMAAATLAKALGYLPLALEHARAYVEETGCSLADYMSYFEAERQALWQEATAPQDYDQKTITTTWNMAFKQARQTEGAAALLNLCCFLAADEIPLTLIRAAGAVAADEMPDGMPDELTQLSSSGRRLDKAIGALRRYSLLTRSGDALTIHRLVQTVARDQLPPEATQTWVTAAVNLIKGAFSFDTNKLHLWEEGRRLIPHISAIIEHAVAHQIKPETVAYLSNQAGFYLKFLGNYAAAWPYYERALQISGKALGGNHPTVAILLNNLGGLLQATGEYEAAQPFMERALQIDEKALSGDHPSVARDLNNLGQLLQATGEYEAAWPYAVYGTGSANFRKSTRP